MQDAPYKSGLTPTASISSAPGNFRPLYLASSHWAGAVSRAQDAAVAGQHKILAVFHLGAWGHWLGDDAAPGSAPRDYPNRTTSRRIGEGRAHPLPGHLACVRWVVVPSGPTEDATPTSLGAYGESEISGRYNGTGGAIASYSSAANPSGSTLPNAAPAKGWGAEFSRLSWVYAPKMPVGNDQLDSVVRAYSEWPRVDALAEHIGTMRLVSAVVQETPVRFAQLDTDDDVTMHAAAGAPWPHQGPRVEQADGMVYEDHRHGVERLLGVAQKQLDRVGPLVAHWSAWDESAATPTSTQGSATNTTTTDALLWDSSISTYDADQPGLAVPCYYAIRYDERVLMPVTIAVAPLRISVNYTTGNTGTAVLTVHTSERSAVVYTLATSSGYSWATFTAQLEVMRDPSDTGLLLQAFIRRGTGTTVTVRDLVIEWGAYDDDP